MGLQAYFGALGASDRAKHYNLAVYVLLQQSWLCLSASSGTDQSPARHMQRGGAEQAAGERAAQLGGESETMTEGQHGTGCSS